MESHLLRGRPAKLLLVSAGNVSNRGLEVLFVPLIPLVVAKFDSNAFLELGPAGIVVRG